MPERILDLSFVFFFLNFYFHYDSDIDSWTLEYIRNALHIELQRKEQRKGKKRKKNKSTYSPVENRWEERSFTQKQIT